MYFNSNNMVLMIETLHATAVILTRNQLSYTAKQSFLITWTESILMPSKNIFFASFHQHNINLLLCMLTCKCLKSLVTDFS